MIVLSKKKSKSKEKQAPDSAIPLYFSTRTVQLMNGDDVFSGWRKCYTCGDVNLFDVPAYPYESEILRCRKAACAAQGVLTPLYDREVAYYIKRQWETVNIANDFFRTFGR